MHRDIHIRVSLDAESPYSSSIGPMRTVIKLEKGGFFL